MAIQPKPFSLDTVLNYRKRLEDIAKNRFSEAKKVHTIIEKKLLTEQKKLKETIEECENLQAEGVVITKLILFEDKITAAQKNITAIEKNLKDKAKLVIQEQENLLIKSQEYQVMHRLKIEQNKAWQHHLNKKEAAMLDEVAIMRHGKNPFDGQ